MVTTCSTKHRPSWTLCLLLLALAAGAARATTDGTGGSVRPLDLAGVRSDTYHFIWYEFFAVALISLAPHDQTNFETQDIGWDSWKWNVTHPHWDKDRAIVNYVLHPYWGASYYVRARERGFGKSQSFWFSATLSTIFEFGAEALVEQPSYQDLLVTPTIGSLVGEYWFWPMRERILAKDTLDTTDRVALVLTDPLGAINDSVDRLFGVHSSVTMATRLGDGDWSRRFAASAGAYQVPTTPVPLRWGVQLRVQW